MVCLVALPALLPPRPAIVTLLGRDFGDVYVYEVANAKARLVAKVNLERNESDILDLASDGRTLIVAEKRNQVTSLLKYRIDNGGIRSEGELSAPRQVGALAMTRDGRCYAGTLLGQVFKVLPLTLSYHERDGNVARSSAELRLNGNAWTLLVGSGGMGDSYDTTVYGGEFRQDRPVPKGAVTCEPSYYFEDVAYLPQTKQFVTMNGSGRATFTKNSEKYARAGASPSKGKAIRALALADGRWIVGDADGTLHLGRFERGSLVSKAAPVKLGEPLSGAKLGFAPDGWAAIAVTRSGSVWWLPVGERLGHPVRIAHQDGVSLVSVSY